MKGQILLMKYMNRKRNSAKMCLPLFINQIASSLSKCAAKQAFYKMCPQDNLVDCADCGGLLVFINEKETFA